MYKYTLEQAVALTSGAHKLLEQARTLSADYVLKWDLADYYFSYGVQVGKPGYASAAYTPPSQTKVPDSFGADAASKLSGALMGMTFNPEHRWLEVTTNRLDEQSRTNKAWLQKATQLVLTYLLFPESRFYPSLAAAMREMVIKGQGLLHFYICRKGKTPMVKFQAYPLNSTLTLLDGDGQVGTVFRTIPMTRAQILERWPDPVSPYSDSFSNPTASNLNRIEEVFHFCTSNREYRKASEEQLQAAPANESKPIVCRYYIKNNSVILEEYYQNRLPYLCPRFETNPGALYGNGPGINALPQLEAVNRAARDAAAASQFSCLPPLREEPGVFEDLLNLGPLARNSMNRPAFGVDVLSPIFAPGTINPQPAMQYVQYLHELIGRIFYLDRISIPQKAAEMRQVEVMARQEENLRELAPVLANIQADIAAPVMHLMLEFLMDEGILEKPPEGLLPTIRFKSPLARAQQIADIQTHLMWLQQVVTPVLQVAPDLVDYIDAETFFKETVAAYNISTKVIRNESQVAQIKQNRQQQELELQQAQAQSQALVASSQAAKNFAEAELKSSII